MAIHWLNPLDQANIPQSSFSSQQLESWGMLHQAQREAVIDQCIQCIPSPPANQLKVMLDEWCQQQRIDSPQKLDRWQQQQGFTSQQWEQFVVRRNHWLLWCQQNLEDKLNSHYLKRKNQLDQVSYSLLRVKEKHLANDQQLARQSIALCDKAIHGLQDDAVPIAAAAADPAPEIKGRATEHQHITAPDR